VNADLDTRLRRTLTAMADVPTPPVDAALHRIDAGRRRRRRLRNGGAVALVAAALVIVALVATVVRGGVRAPVPPADPPVTPGPTGSAAQLWPGALVRVPAPLPDGRTGRPVARTAAGGIVLDVTAAFPVLHTPASGSSRELMTEPAPQGWGQVESTPPQVVGGRVWWQRMAGRGTGRRIELWGMSLADERVDLWGVFGTGTSITKPERVFGTAGAIFVHEVGDPPGGDVAFRLRAPMAVPERIPLDGSYVPTGDGSWLRLLHRLETDPVGPPVLYRFHNLETGRAVHESGTASGECGPQVCVRYSGADGPVAVRLEGGVEVARLGGEVSGRPFLLPGGRFVQVRRPDGGYHLWDLRTGALAALPPGAEYPDTDFLRLGDGVFLDVTAIE